MSYSSTIGRFMERDPIGYDDGMNPYEFAHGNPITWRDPTGLFVELDGPHDALVHYLIGVGQNAWLSDGMVAALKITTFIEN